MSSARNQNYPPALPPSLNANYETHPPTADVPHQPTTLPLYTPYLGLEARLSQILLNRWTVLLFLILCRLLLSIKDINYDIANAKSEALSACTSVENAGSALASMPHYLSEGVNAMAADGVTKAVNGLMDMLQLTVTGMEEVVVFYVNMMTSTYVCLITLAVTGSLHVAISMIEDTAAFINKSIQSITGDMATDVTTFQNSLNSFLSTLNVGSLFGGSKTPPQINLGSQIAALNSIKVDPTTLDADLTKLNASIPTFAEVQNFTDNVLRLPFEEVKKLINESMVAYTFDKSVFPVAQKKALTFCSTNPALTNFFAGLIKAVNEARKAFIAVLIIVALMVCLPMAWLERRRWYKSRATADLIEANAIDKLDAVYIASRPFTSRYGIKIANWFKTPKRKILARWFIAYATSLPALFVLALGVAGLFSCLLQLAVLRTLDAEVPKLAQEIGNFSDQVVGELNTASTAWATGANAVINSTNTKINQDVFGWVNTTTHALNDTLNAFSDEMVKALNATFGGTVLYDPITEVLNCLIGLKIAGIEKGLTWVSDNAYVTFPEFQPDVFSLGAKASLSNDTSTKSFLSNPGDVAGDSVTSAVVKVSNKLADGIKQEAIISAFVVLFWFVYMLGGGFMVLFWNFKKDKTRAEGQAMAGGDNGVREHGNMVYAPSYDEAMRAAETGDRGERKWGDQVEMRDLSSGPRSARRDDDPFNDNHSYDYGFGPEK